MIDRMPPRLASWVLKQWGSPYHRESLALAIGFLLSIRGGTLRDARPPACMGPGPLTGR
jgi:hypothetical protein